MDNIKDFKEDVKLLCQKYNVTICHEDTQGAFIIQPKYDAELMNWFMDAMEIENE